MHRYVVIELLHRFAVNLYFQWDGNQNFQQIFICRVVDFERDQMQSLQFFCSSNDIQQARRIQTATKTEIEIAEFC